jgi:hypothetical protein
MQRIKTVVLACLVVFALSAVASASASAQACTKKAGSKSWALCVEGEKMVSSESFKAQIKTATNVRIATTYAGLQIEILCQAASGTGEFGPSVHALQVTFSSCKVAGSLGKKCEVPSSLEVKPLTGTYGPGIENVLLAPTTPPEWTGWMFKSVPGQTCPATLTAHTWKFTGSQECTLKSAEVEAAEHELVCEAKGSKLKFEGAAFELSFEDGIELSGAHKLQKYSLIESA